MELKDLLKLAYQTEGLITLLIDRVDRSADGLNDIKRMLQDKVTELQIAAYELEIPAGRSSEPINNNSETVEVYDDIEVAEPSAKLDADQPLTADDFWNEPSTQFDAETEQTPEEHYDVVFDDEEGDSTLNAEEQIEVITESEEEIEQIKQSDEVPEPYEAPEPEPDEAPELIDEPDDSPELSDEPVEDCESNEVSEPEPEREPEPEPPIVTDFTEDSEKFVDDVDFASETEKFDVQPESGEYDVEPEVEEAEGKSYADLNSRVFSQQVATDFQKMISINDWHRFYRELFGKSSIQFNEAIDLVRTMQSFPEAEEYFYDDLSWDRDDDNVKDFMNLVRIYLSRK